MAATRRTRARSSSSAEDNNHVLLLAISLVVLCAASTSAVAAAAKTPSEAGLSVDFHAVGCSQLDDIVRSAVEQARRAERQVTAGLLRIFFHDCFPQGCDASLLLDKTHGDSEQHQPQNAGLLDAALTLIETIRGRVHSQCGATVSCADILAFATSHAVKLAGGPFIPMERGRSDSRGPAPAWAVARLPPPTHGVTELLANFSIWGLDGFDLVALSGAHTVGMARCSAFGDRIDDRKANKDSFERELTDYCGRNTNKKRDLDRTPFDFDNSYFVQLKNGRGVLSSDQALYRDGRTGWLVDRYAANQQEFFDRFKESMLKLSRIRGPDPGPVRNNCFRRSSVGANLLVLDPTAGAGEDDPILAATA